MMRWACLSAALLIAACGSDPPANVGEPGSRDAPADAEALDAEALDADAGALDAAALDADAGGFPGCTLLPSSPDYETVETRCDGIDNDCDRIVDLLLPVPANACTTTQAGPCGHGFYSCVRGEKVCLTPSPSPEVQDGVDNDCNGTIDDVAPAQVHARMTFLVPRYLWTDAPGDIATAAELLRARGVPFDLPMEGSDWFDTLDALDRYALAFVPAYLEGDAVDPLSAAKMEAFVRNGGVLVITRPTGNATSTQAVALAGLSASEHRLDLGELRFDGDPAPPLFAFDAPEERSVLVTDDITHRPLQIFALAPLPGTRVLANAYGGMLGPLPAITRRAVGQGAVYALGHDLMSYDHYRCYINCFEPGRDLLALFLRDALREAAHGHTAFLHTVPGEEDSAFLLTHDVDAPDAQQAGAWGMPGALQMSMAEEAQGARGTYYVTTDYVANYYSPDVVSQLCMRGMCPIGAHSVRHAENFATQPLGDCMETPDNYLDSLSAQTTLCGEVRVSTALLLAASGSAPRIWRTPYLRVNPSLYDVLADNGYFADSSYAIGDYKISLPYALDGVGFRQDLFHHQPIFELPIAIEDGIGFVDGMGHEGRIELQPDYFAEFMSNWSYVLLRHAANRTVTVGLIHPSYGVGQGPENVATKIRAASFVLEAAAGTGAKIDLGVDVFLEFWRARHGVDLDVSFDSATGYQGELTIGAEPITRLTLELGDQLRSFSCMGCGAYHIRGKRVVLEATLAAGGRYSFTATP